MPRNTNRTSRTQSTRNDETSVSIAKFLDAIRTLPEGEPHDNPRVWYRTQKEHWLGWLSAYDGPGAYGRVTTGHDAKFAYNHIVCPPMLLWLIDAAGVDRELVKTAQNAVDPDTTLMQQAGTIRKHVPWAELAKTLWPSNSVVD